MTTQYANASYQEVIDLHTESDTVSVVGIHTPTSDTPVKMLHGFWEQFRKFKYNGCSISLVPAARLPADPLQVSYGAGATTIDPRDMLNPILFHGCHGNDMGAILNTFYNDCATPQGEITRQLADSVENNILPAGNVVGNEYVEALYYKALTDKTWLKAHPQKGFRKSGLHPMVYSLATTVQLAPLDSGTTGARPAYVSHNDLIGGNSISYANNAGIVNGSVVAGAGFGFPSFSAPTETISPGNPEAMVGLFTPRLQKLGWMDTRNVTGANGSVTATLNGQAVHDKQAMGQFWQDVQAKLDYATVPKVFMGMIMLPPAYKTEQYFRLVVNHSFSFAKFRGASMLYNEPGTINSAPGVFNFNEDPSKHIDPEPEPEPDGDDKLDL